VHFIEAFPPTACKSGPTGGNAGKPLAAPGELCVYGVAGALQGTTLRGIFPISGLPDFLEFEQGASRSGAMIVFNAPTGEDEEEEDAHGWGSFAVTGCDPTPGATEFACP
jgi:hypothetical protein